MIKLLPLYRYFVSLKMKARDIIKMIEEDGWYLVRQKGSHKQYKHKTKKGW